jgi:hypothetical protein
VYDAGVPTGARAGNLAAGFQEPGLSDPETQKCYYNVATGPVAALARLAAWFHNCDRRGLAEALGLRAEQRVLYGQSVGYPA